MSSVPIREGARKSKRSLVTASFLAILLWTAVWCVYNLFADRLHAPHLEVNVALAAYLSGCYALLLFMAVRRQAR